MPQNLNHFRKLSDPSYTETITSIKKSKLNRLVSEEDSPVDIEKMQIETNIAQYGNNPLKTAKAVYRSTEPMHVDFGQYQTGTSGEL